MGKVIHSSSSCLLMCTLVWIHKQTLNSISGKVLIDTLATSILSFLQTMLSPFCREGRLLKYSISLMHNYACTVPYDVKLEVDRLR